MRNALSSLLVVLVISFLCVACGGPGGESEGETGSVGAVKAARLFVDASGSLEAVTLIQPMYNGQWQGQIAFDANRKAIYDFTITDDEGVMVFNMTDGTRWFGDARSLGVGVKIWLQVEYEGSSHNDEILLPTWRHKRNSLGNGYDMAVNIIKASDGKYYAYPYQGTVEEQASETALLRVVAEFASSHSFKSLNFEIGDTTVSSYGFAPPPGVASRKEWYTDVQWGTKYTAIINAEKADGHWVVAYNRDIAPSDWGGMALTFDIYGWETRLPMEKIIRLPVPPGTQIANGGFMLEAKIRDSSPAQVVLYDLNGLIL